MSRKMIDFNVPVILIELFIILTNQVFLGVSQDNVPCLSLNQIDNYTCAACIQLPGCAWCSALDQVDTKSRCDTMENLLRRGSCPTNRIIAPESKMSIVVNEDLGKKQLDVLRLVQLKPQEINLELRVGEPQVINAQFKQAFDQPIDLYVLEDISESMTDDLEKLISLVDTLAEKMKSISADFRYAFGSFVDKDVVPFFDMDNRMSRGRSNLPYSYRHSLNFTTDATFFKEAVLATYQGGEGTRPNSDTPESSIDALVQALVCKRVGWRETARRMVVVSTDDKFHMAGDGRLGRLIEPMQGTCELNDTGYYLKESQWDYASLSLLHSVLLETRANVIFAVTEKNVNAYKMLKAALPGVSTSVGQLSDDSSNIVQLIEDAYKTMSENLRLKDNIAEADMSEIVRLTYRTQCTDKSSVLRETNFCKDVHVGDAVDFAITVQALSCWDGVKSVVISPEGLSDTLTLNMRTLCKCACADEVTASDINSPRCNAHGNFTCGVCKCNAPHLGDSCQCDSSKLDINSEAMLAQCRGPQDTRICSDRGRCLCGNCDCFSSDVSGRYCECTNYGCPYHNRLLCSGHGKCYCDQCVCNAGWNGTACSCATTTDSCIATSSGKVCNGMGTCVCGKCECTGTDERGMTYTGPTCEVCKSCQNECPKYRACVFCKAFGTATDKAKCADCSIEPFMVDKLPDESEHTNLFSCQYVDDDGCMFYYKFKYDNQTITSSNVTVWVRKQRDCPPPPNFAAISLGIVGAVVVLGLLLLVLWKCWALYHDRREYQQFQRETAKPQFKIDSNPLFVPATTTVENVWKEKI